MGKEDQGGGGFASRHTLSIRPWRVDGEKEGRKVEERKRGRMRGRRRGRKGIVASSLLLVWVRPCVEVSKK